MSERLAKSAGLISLATMTSRALGLARDILLAKIFGATMAMDAFNVASRIPNLVRDLFAEGAMSAAFVPTFTRHLKAHGREAAWRLGNQVINALLAVTGVFVVLGMLFAGPILSVFPDEFATANGGEKLALTLSLTRVMMPFLTLVALAVALAGMLNSLRRFFIPALSPAIYNVAVIVSALAFVPLCPLLGWPPIMGIAIGSLLGGVGQIVLQLPVLWREGYRYQAVLNPRDPGLGEIMMLMGPGTIGVAAAQVNLLVNTYLATGEGTGPVSWLGYAFRLMYLPIGLVGVSIATAAIPEIARQAAAEAFGDMRRTLSSGLRMMLMLSVPATLGLMALSAPIVELLLERGAFTNDDTLAVAQALVCYAPGLVGYSVVKIASPSFYALRDARTPVMVSLLAIAVNLVLNLTLVDVMGYRGLALGTAIAAVVNAALLIVLLSRRIGGLDGRRVLTVFVKILIASLAMGAAAFVTEAWLDATLPQGLTAIAVNWRPVVRVILAVSAGVAVLALVAAALRLRELTDAWGKVIGSLRRR